MVVIAEDLVRRVVEYNLNDSRLARILKERHLPSAEFHQRVLQQMRRVHTRSDDPILQDIRAFLQNENRPPLSYELFMQLFGTGIRDIINQFFRDRGFRDAMYFSSLLAILAHKGHIVDVFICKKGRRHAYLCFYDNAERIIQNVIEFQIP